MQNDTGSNRKYEIRILSAVFLMGIIGILWTFFAGFGLAESEYNFLGKTKKITLSPGTPVTQTFTAHRNNLTQIRFVLGKADIDRDERFEFRLMDEACQETLVLKTLRSEPRSQGAYTVFAFPAIADSENKRYCFSVVYFSDENHKGDKPYLSATDNPDSIFPDRILTDTNKNKVYPSQTLFLRPAYTEGSLPSDLSGFTERLAQYKPEFIKEYIPILGIILLLATTFLGICLIRTRN
jgi:hypothetical protein